MERIMGELRKRGDATGNEKPKGTGRFGRLGDYRSEPKGKPDHDHDHSHSHMSEVNEIIEKVKRLRIMAERLMDLHDKVSADTSDIQALREYHDAIEKFMTTEAPSDVLTIFGAGVGALAELRKRGI
jgi:hypothetical protein